ncbi:hypothetical protein RCL_jg16205.t1 [Rhizophagus clarus]|uniref:Uncharacterized protein n=1 Tax=Rhizophagus clarus TaxID=94130 RepID=A0A8H3MCD3_9GLOM|nr:hypothetical protein RCL_jg16205.t1 [Rhizophagus clarus]
MFVRMRKIEENKRLNDTSKMVHKILIRKRRNTDYNEERMQGGCTTPSPGSPKLPMDNPFIEKDEDGVIIINDVD